ncbi:hypothetical protein D1007_08059 [Hordeum vulgare]|nr:hypothetical protein D1007_08059 [Hordeum vulgare]
MNPSDGTGGGTDACFTESEWDRLGPEVQDVLKENVPKDDAQHVETVPATAVNEKMAPVGTPITGVYSNMPVRPLSPSTSGIEDLASSPARAVMTPVSKKKKSTVKKFSAKCRASSGSKTSVAGMCCRFDDDMGAVSGSPPRAAPLSPSAPSPSICTPTSTARKGTRVHDSGESVAAHAKRRAAARDLLPSGIPLSPPSLPSSPIRLVLPSLFDDHLLHVLEDVGVSIDAGFGSPYTVLSIIRANEMAQAAIAKAKDLVVANGIAATSTGVDGGVIGSG